MIKNIKTIGIILAVVGLIILIPYPNSCSWDFRNCLWGPANQVVQGNSAYSSNMPYGNIPPSWFPMATGAFFFLGWLPCLAASKIWFAVEMIGLGYILWLVWGRALPSPRMFLISLLLLVLFPPVYLHFHNGQYTIFFMVLMMTVVFVPSARRWRPLLLAIGLTKPQLGMLIYPGLLIAEYRERGLKAALGLFFGTILCVILLTIPLFIAYPAWIIDLVNLLISYAGSPWDTPSLYAQFPVMLGPVGRGLWAAAFVGVFVLATWLWWSKDSKTALVWSFALTNFITPYIWSYDFVMLLPLLVWLIIRSRHLAAQIILVAGAVFVDFLIVAARWKSEISDGIQWWIPAAMLLVFIIGLVVEKKNRLFPPYQEEPVGRTP